MYYIRCRSLNTKGPDISMQRCGQYKMVAGTQIHIYTCTHILVQSLKNSWIFYWFYGNLMHNSRPYKEEPTECARTMEQNCAYIIRWIKQGLCMNTKLIVCLQHGFYRIAFLTTIRNCMECKITKKGFINKLD